MKPFESQNICNLPNYPFMGGRLQPGSQGAEFSVWAPRASQVSVIGDFNGWDQSKDRMVKKDSGLWKLEVPNAKPGERYKFAIETVSGEWIHKADPYALQSELRPGNSSILVESSYAWTDCNWIEERKKKDKLKCPINIYEVHLGSWMKKECGGYLSYRELAASLADHCRELGFTHIELLPLNEHPLDQSWGYQVTGFFSVTSRYGSPSEFKAFVDHMHSSGIGVVIDWVPSHFPKDAFALSLFDGEPLYEHRDEAKRDQPLWSTLRFDYSRIEVRHFLIQSALFWIEEMHMDGIRVDSVAAILYDDFAESGSNSSRVCTEGALFLKELSSAVNRSCPSVILIAEDASKYPGMTKPLDQGGMGFDLKWNLGWMHDTASYLQTPYNERYKVHEKLTFGLMYAFNEQHALCLSHDEVSTERGSLWHKASPENINTQLRHLRLLYSYMMCYPGKKLFFMGYEFGDMEPWTGENALSWQLKEDPEHRALYAMIQSLNKIYLKESALWENDFSWEGFEWILTDACKEGVIVYKRRSKSTELICAHNFSCRPFELELESHRELIFSSDDQTDLIANKQPVALKLTLPQESTVILK